MSFCNLHTHTAKGSLLDSILTVEQMVKFAKDNNQSAIGLTDHGSMASFVDFVKECNKNGVKPIIGNEIYEVDDMAQMNDTKEKSQPRYHLILLCRTQQGFKNLLKITSISRTEGFYKKPRIDLKRIKEDNLGDGIICLTACQAGRLSKYLTTGASTESIDCYIAELKSTFEEVYCELQSHNTYEQAEANKKILSYALNHNIPYVITTDAHMLNPKIQDAHSIFVGISEDREVGEMYNDCYLQTEENVYEILGNQFDNKIIAQSIKNIEYLVDSIEDIDIGLNKGNIMPKVHIESGFSDHKEYLRHLVYLTFEEKFGGLPIEEQEKRRQRIEMELPVLYAVDYTDYFIMLYMLSKEARKRKIPIGYSRGSGANCLCLFMLNVTQIDSVRWDLDFSRFANTGRKSMADFDWDISKRRRKEFVEISEELFGKSNVAPIATYNTLSTKVAIRDIGKVLNEKVDSPYYQQIPYSLRDEVAKMVPTIKTLNDLGEEEEKDVLLKDILNNNKKLNNVYLKFPLWFQYVMDIEGLPKSRGRHAAGTLITPEPVTEYCPLCYDSDKNVMIELEMHNAMDDLGLIKMDYLGLETLDIIDDTLKLSNLTWDDVDINHLDLSDKEVFDNVYKQGNTIGVFQMESAEARKMCIQAKADTVEDIIVVNAANRPGTKDNFPDYCNNKLHPDQISVIHEELKKLFSKTHCILLYQEQALQIFRYAGFPEEQVDNARRAIGKKKKDVMKQLETDFRSGLQRLGWNDEQISELWDLILKQSEYSFNRGHAVAYGLLSYLTAYLKTHYTLNFMSALLTSKSDKIDKLSVVINDCKRMGINVVPPNINHSDLFFSPQKEKNKILFGLLGVKGLGGSIIDKIISNRPYTGLYDMFEKVSDKTAIITLIKSGSLPVKDKMTALKKYAIWSFGEKKYKAVSTLPSPYSKLYSILDNYGIDYTAYKDDKNRLSNEGKVILLKKYNKARESEFNNNQKQALCSYLRDFQEKYAKNEYMWEFETLSMFLTDDPLKEAHKYIEIKIDEISGGEEATVLCVIAGIQRKKDRNGNQFAYLNLYTPVGILEAVIWSAQLKEYSSLIKNGSCLATKIKKKDDGTLTVIKVKPYQTWLNQKRKAGVKI